MTNETSAAVWLSRVPTTAKAIARVGIFVTASVALVTDVLAPVGSFAKYAAGATALLFLVFALLPKHVPRIDAVGRACFRSYWRAPVLATLVVSTVLLAATHVLTSSAPAGGWVASQVPAVGDLQGELGIVEAQTRAIAEATQGIKEDTEEISAKLDDVKRETSEDPRKELANLGVAWSTQSFVDALTAGDTRTVDLFLQAGMSPTTLHGGASAVLYMLQAKLPDPRPVLTLLIQAGFDVNANLYDPVILRHYSRFLPPYFESPDLPTGYDPNAGTFEGPALLWLTIRAANGWPIEEDWDVDAIVFLKSHGADTKLPEQVLESMESVWGEQASYQRVRAAIL